MHSHQLCVVSELARAHHKEHSSQFWGPEQKYRWRSTYNTSWCYKPSFQPQNRIHASFLSYQTHPQQNGKPSLSLESFDSSRVPCSKMAGHHLATTTSTSLAPFLHCILYHEGHHTHQVCPCTFCPNASPTASPWLRAT